MAVDRFRASVDEFVDALGVLVRRIRAEANEQQLSWTESAALSRLAREGAATTAELARAQGIKPQSMGTVVAGLEAQGLIQRTAHPTDGRQMLLALTEKGAAMHKERREAKRHWLAQEIASLREDEQETLFAAGKIVERLARGSSL